jgi:hypothetical protein
VTDRFVDTTETGEFLRKTERMRDIESRGGRPTANVRERSIRAHGGSAIVNLRVGDSESTESWMTIIMVKEKATWREAAVITTPITGAARATAR